MFCPKCGKEHPDDAAACPSCGASLIDPPQRYYVQPQSAASNTSVLTIACLVIAVFGVMVVAVLAAILFPVFARAREAARKASCQNNMKELALSFSMYMGDYDGALPSSALRNGSRTWNPSDFQLFVKEKGSPGGPKTLMMALAPFMKNKDIIWCPSDTEHGAGRVSYYYKAAIDRAWYEGSKKNSDFDFPSDQVTFWEHNGWHWGDASRGATDGVTINVAFLDGHVASKIIQDSGYTEAENPPDPLPASGVGEPAWFNWNFLTNSGADRTAAYDPHKFGDRFERSNSSSSSAD